jgi:diguanylate cyclase (GGDEF)-like protein
LTELDEVRAQVSALAVTVPHRESTVRESVELKAAALDALNHRIAVVGEGGRILCVNYAWQQFAARPMSPAHAKADVGDDYLGCVNQGAMGEPGIALPASVGAGIRSVLRGDRPQYQCEYSVHSQGGPAWFLLVVTSLGGQGSGPAVVSHVEMRSRQQIETDAPSPDELRDPLTGLANRRLLRDRLTMALAQRPIDGRRTAMFVVGIEDLDVVGDDLGMTVVDEVLIEVVRRLQATVRPGDTIARIAAAQIAFVCNSVRGMTGVEAIRLRLSRVLAEPLRIAGHPAPVWIRTTIGAALDGVDGIEPDGLLHAADVDRYLHESESPRG